MSLFQPTHKDARLMCKLDSEFFLNSIRRPVAAFLDFGVPSTNNNKQTNEASRNLILPRAIKDDINVLTSSPSDGIHTVAELLEYSENCPSSLPTFLFSLFLLPSYNSPAVLQVLPTHNKHISQSSCNLQSHWEKNFFFSSPVEECLATPLIRELSPGKSSLSRDPGQSSLIVVLITFLHCG